ncbi:MAG: hypothetical protein ACK452_01690, partial [Bacteroidota bacterium]
NCTVTVNMIRHLECHEIDFELWDACVASCSSGLPYAFTWYLNSVCENWSGLVLDDYKAVMPLPFKTKFGLKYVYQPFFTQQLGVYGVGDVTDFITSIPKSFLKVQTLLNYKSGIESQHTEEQINLVLNLKQENLKMKFSQNCKRNLNKSEKFNLSINSCEPDILVQLFKSNKGKTISHLKEKNYNILIQLISELNKRNFLDSYGIFSESMELLGGVILIRYKKRLIFFFSAINEKGKECSAMFRLVNWIIETYKVDSDLLDFEGSNNEQLARFYKGFGAIEENYFSFRRFGIL